MSKIFNISASLNFVETLADRLLKEYSNNNLELAEVLILLPNRRACHSLSDAFVRLQGMKPTLLPQMRAIGDISEDEILINSLAYSQLLQFPPAIKPLERTLLLMKLIKVRYKEFGFDNISLAQACYLAQELGNLLDSIAMLNLSWDNLQNIVPLEYSAHWQETLKFLKIITFYWPDILSERKVIDNSTLQNLLMQKQCEIWQSNPPKQKIIIAGTTAVSTSMKQLVNTVYQLDNGEIYLAGLDKHLSDDAWNQIDETHPQFELKQLLEYLKLSRQDIPDINIPPNIAREKLISAIMLPARSTDEWRYFESPNIEGALDGIHLIEAPDIRFEALSIALIIRQTLETKEKTVALVTPNRNLARRVSAELRRWKIIVDDSAGIPLSLTPWGIFVRDIINAATDLSSRANILALLKNPLFSYQKSPDKIYTIVSRIDKNLWREQEEDEQAKTFLNSIISILTPLNQLITSSSASLKDLLQTHLGIAEILSTPSSGEATFLWQNEDGHAGSKLIADLLENSSILDNINPSEYHDFLETMMVNTPVRNNQSSHPRAKILGPLEARLNHYDTIIIGGCIEGVWPPSPQADPWMSRPMKKDFGFILPEQQIGVNALDFSNLLGAKEVYLTYCQMADGAQTIKSRWLMRLLTFLQAANIDYSDLYDNLITYLAKDIDSPKPEEIIKITPPAPKPPLKLRPHKLSASAFEKLLRDPYSVFAEYILKLKPLGELQSEPDQSDFGNFVHQILEDFSNTYPSSYPDSAKEILINMGEQYFKQACFPADKMAFWRPKFQQIVEWITSQEITYRQQISHIYNEVWGTLTFKDTPMGNFEIYAKADRIDSTTNGSYNIIDYKTGRARSAKEVETGYAPQLPIEALIAQSGGFTNLPPKPINQLMYWKLGDKVISINKEINQLLADTQKRILEIINRFADINTGYLSRPNPKHVPEYSDYEHLARVKEWAIKDDGDDN